MIKKVLALVLSFSLILSISACKDKNNGTEAGDIDSGRYIEEEISSDAQPWIAGELFHQSDKTVFIDNEDMKLYTHDKDTDKFEQTDIPLTRELGGDAVPVSVAGLPDGSYIFTYYIFNDEDDGEEEKDYTPLCAYLSADGKLQKLDFDVPNLMIDAFDSSDDGRIFASAYDGNIYEIDAARQSAVQLFSLDRQAAAFDVVSDYIIGADSKNIEIYDLKEHKLLDTSDVLRDFWKEQKLTTQGAEAKDPVCDFCAGSDNSVYIITPNGLYRYIIDGNQVEQLLDATAYHLGSPSYHVRSVISESDNSFLVTYKEGTVMRYRFDLTASNKMSSSLKIYSLTENDTLSQIISEYKINNPNVSVEYKTGMGKNSGVTYEDAVKNLNTEICSDETPDILMLDGLNIENFIQKNMLTDLKDYADKIDPDDSLLDNIAKHYQDGGLYTMPCKFEIPAIAGKKDNLGKINSFTAFADMIENQHKIIKNSPAANFFTQQEVIDAALDFTSNDIITGSTVDKKALKTMIEDCCRIYRSEKSVIPEDFLTAHNSYKITSTSSADRWIFNLSGKSMDILYNDERLASGTTDGFRNSLNIITSLNDQNKKIGYRYGLTEDSTLYIPKCSLGICSTGKNNDNAVGFLKTAFSSQVQNIELNDGFPVSTVSLNYFYNKGKTENGYGFAASNDFDEKPSMLMAKWMDESEISEFSSKIQELDTPVYIDTMTRNIITNTCTKCLDGVMTSDEAVDEITDKLSLRMQE
ncbi:MAG: extracellular solute-binding protein [Oscillospiraceae bacterium]|nr:extracellular solute-binding protein [Oscillospiraceae bacterium]